MYLTMITNILLRCIILFVIYSYAFAQVGDECVIKSNGLNGICKLATDCPSVEEDARNGVSPTICGFYQLNIPIVCCENNLEPQPNDNVLRPNPNINYNSDTIIYPDDFPKAVRKSEQKCEEYAKPLTGSVQAIPLVIDTQPINIDYVKCDYNGVALIVGGKPALPGEFPFMAAIGYVENNQIKWKCGGTLISEYFVLTAAHCIVTRSARPQIVRLGDLDLTRADDGSVYADYKIKTTIVNDRYRFPQKYNDIALIQLETKVKFTKFIRPACLYTKSKVELPQAVATGWGSLNYGATETSKKLMKVSLNLYENRICEQTFGRENRTLPRGIVSTMVCAGELKGGKDTCQGDSGGPLLITKPGNQCKFYVVGVTSFGRSCGQVNTPGVYTRVSDYVDWIEEKVWR